MAAFQVNEQGSREAIVAHIQTAQELEADGKTPAKDQTQVKGAVALAISEINALPKEFAGAHVILSGSDSGQVRTISVQVAGIKLRL